MRVAIIGVGNMGLKHLRVYSRITSVKVIAVSDLNEDHGRKIAGKYKLKFYKDYKKLLAREQIDAVSICVPTSCHYLVARHFITNRIHVLLEKPISDDLKSGKKLVSLAKKANVNLMIGHIERHNPAVRRLKEIMQKGEIGKVIAITARRIGGFPPQIKDANIAVDLAIHDIDVINYLLDKNPSRIVVNKQKNHIKKREDSVEFFLKYKKTSAYIQANWISPVKLRKLTVTGTEGYLEMDYVNQKIEFYKSNYDKFLLNSGDFSDFVLRFSEPDRIDISVAKKEPLKEEIEFFIKSIKSKVYSSPMHAVDALKIALAK